MLYFSKTTNGFYDDALSPERPADAVTITAAQHSALLAAQAAGHILGADASGQPQALAAALDQLRTAKAAELRRACRAALLGGFTSSALGAIRAYPSTPSDQQNLSDALLTALPSPSLETPLWCTNSAGWAFQPHTALQVGQVHSDWVTFRIAQQRKLLLLQTSTDTAASAQALAAITW